MVDAEPLQRSFAGAAHVLRATVDGAEAVVVGPADDAELRRQDNASRRPAIARPTSSSLWPSPYTSAVSRNVRRARAPGRCRQGLGLVGGPVDLAHPHAPSPWAETSRPWPSVRVEIVMALKLPPRPRPLVTTAAYAATEAAGRRSRGSRLRSNHARSSFGSCPPRHRQGVGDHRLFVWRLDNTHHWWLPWVHQTCSISQSKDSAISLPWSRRSTVWSTARTPSSSQSTNKRSRHRKPPIDRS